MNRDLKMNNNEIKLIGYYGSDETHALSAWTSTARDLKIIGKDGKTKKDRIPELLKMLAENNHGTPFEKSSLHFLVLGEIASHIHCLKHRIGVSINAQSARYGELKEDNYYLPVDWDEEERKKLEKHTLLCFERYHDTLQQLKNKGMPAKRAKESARFYLPYSSQIKWDIMFNFRSFIHFLNLRNKSEAQLEIKHIANTMLNLVKSQCHNDFEYSLKAFNL